MYNGIQMGSNEKQIKLTLPHGDLIFPAYLPDGTYGVVRSVDAGDLERCGLQAMMMNSFHLMQRPGSSTIQALGGLNKMSGWHKPIFTDSGGFQAYSLIRQNPKFGVIHDKGLSFVPEGAKRKFQLTPEKSVQLQISYGSDVIICLDDCTHVDNTFEEQQHAVLRTINWAKRSKQAYFRAQEQKGWEEGNRPKIFAVVQGGAEQSLRRQCAEALLEIGFDGYGFGGWPLDGEGNLVEDILSFTRELIPREYPMHALGVGHPENIVACEAIGYDIFDSAMPTRDARHGRLYTFQTEMESPHAGLSGAWLRYLYINDEKHIKNDGPISSFCDCLCCQRYSIGYLRHLFKLNDSLYPRLATMHNMRFMMQLTARIRGSRHD